jgi:diaminopimelate epimerase
MKTNLVLYRYSGAGNTFVLFDFRDPEQQKAFNQRYKAASKKNIAKLLCRRYKSTGGDGLVLLKKSKEKGIDFAWDFYNPDGSRAEMCGNAARCVGLHITGGKKTKQAIRLKTGAGIVEISVESAQKISVTMRPVPNPKLRQTLKLAGIEVTYDFVNASVPHVVIELKKWRLGLRTRRFAKLLKTHKIFKPNSANVTYFKHLKGASIQAATYERGIDGYTQACGTGAVAAAISFSKRYLLSTGLVSVNMPGGKLIVDLRKSRPVLTGPARRFPKTHL